MHAFATRLGGSRQRLHGLTLRIADHQLGNPLRAVVVSSTTAVTRRCASSSSDDREREIAAELSRAPTPTPPPLGTPQQQRAATEILVNRSGLMPTRMTHEKDDRPPLTGLAKELEQMIVLNGPMTVPEYMIYALQHPKYGYYMRQKDKIGRGGDFITAPEISQVKTRTHILIGLFTRLSEKRVSATLPLPVVGLLHGCVVCHSNQSMLSGKKGDEQQICCCAG